MITKKQGKAYAAITLDLLYKMKIKTNPEVLAEQMELIYNLYEADEVEDLYNFFRNLRGDLIGIIYCWNNVR